MRIPFCPLPINRAKVVGRKLYGLLGPLSRTSKNFKETLSQAGIDLDEREYLSIALFSAIFVSIIIFLPVTIISTSFIGLINGILLSVAISAVFFFIIIQYLKMYPKLIIKRRVANLERNLIFALRDIYVQVKSGVSIFDTIVSVSSGSYGAVSNEFKDVIKEVNAGVPMENALENLIFKNPSVYFRRVIRQISNGLKAGSDISIVMKSIIENISAEQKIEIKKYGSKLNPLTLVYMMVAVILPVIGITFMIVLSTFSGLSISENMFWAILVFLAIFQFMFIGIIKSKRPNLI